MSGAKLKITFLLPFRDNHYTFVKTPHMAYLHGDASADRYSAYIEKHTDYILSYTEPSSLVPDVDWLATGYVSSFQEETLLVGSQGNNTNIITYSGWIQDGDEIPLPIGVKESDCEWFVTPAMRSVDDNDAIMCFTTTRDGYIDFTSRPDNNYYSYQTNSLSKWRYKNFYPRGRVVVNRTAQRGPRLAFYMLFVGIKNKGYSY